MFKTKIMNNFLYVIPALLLVLNVLALYIVFRTYFEVKSRRHYQIAFIWLVPVFGACLAIYINREAFFTRSSSGIKGQLTEISDSEAITYAVAANHCGGR